MPELFGMNILGTVLVIGGILLVSGIKIMKEYDRGVIFRLGRMVDPRGPGKRKPTGVDTCLTCPGIDPFTSRSSVFPRIAQGKRRL